VTVDGKAWRIFTWDGINNCWEDVTTDQDEDLEGILKSFTSFKAFGLDVKIVWRDWSIQPHHPQQLLFD